MARQSSNSSLVNSEAGVEIDDVTITHVSTGTIVKEDAPDTSATMQLAARENAKEDEHGNDDEVGMASKACLHGKPLMTVSGMDSWSYQFHHTCPKADHHNSSQHSDPLSSTNLYIKGLPPYFMDKHLRDMCNFAGKIVSAKCIVDMNTNLCVGYGFVDYVEHYDAMTALKFLQGNGILAQFAKLQEHDPTNLYIANLPKSYTKENVHTLLSPFGTVTSIRILRENDGQACGVALARMSLACNCQKAITVLSGQIIQDASKPLRIKLADKKRSTKQMYMWPPNMEPRMYLQPVNAFQVPGSYVGWPWPYSAIASSSADEQELTSHMAHLQVDTSLYHQASSTTMAGAPICIPLGYKLKGYLT